MVDCVGAHLLQTYLRTRFLKTGGHDKLFDLREGLALIAFPSRGLPDFIVSIRAFLGQKDLVFRLWTFFCVMLLFGLIVLALRTYVYQVVPALEVIVSIIVLAIHASTALSPACLPPSNGRGFTLFLDRRDVLLVVRKAG